MKNTLRKVAAAVSAVAMSLGLLVATAAPASAGIFASPSPNAGQTYNLVIGDSLTLDLTCIPPDGQTTTKSQYEQGSIPPGMTMTDPGILSGTPTTLGSYTFGSWRCFTANSQTAGGPAYMTTINVNAPFTPAPSLTGVALNDANCTVKVVGVLPNTPVPSSVTMVVASSNSNTILTLRNYSAGELIDLNIPMIGIADWAGTSSDLLSSSANGNTNHCDKDVTLTLSYQYGGAPSANDSVTLHPRAVQNEPTLFASTVLDQACTIRITGTVTRHSDDDMIKVSSRTFDRGVDIMLKGIKPDVPIDVTLKLDDVDALTNNPNVHSVYSWGDPVECRNLGLDAIVYYAGGGYGVTVKSTAWLRGECPAGQYGKIIATSTLIYRECLPAPLGHYVPEANVLAEPVPCDDGSYSDLLGSTGCKDAEPGHFVAGFGEAFQTECPAGTFASDYNQNRCVPAPIGYFVDQMGATEATQCPAGFTTMTEGSMNSSNCFRDDDTMCLPGSYSSTGYEPCTVATPGFYVPFDGARNQMPCDLGTYSDTAGASSCTKAAKGYYVNKTGASSATKCAAGLTTELSGARSKNDCYKQKFQTAKAIKTPTKLKFGAKHETAGRADAGLNLNAVATGACTVTKINKTVKVNGKSVKQPRWVIKATKKAGNCKVTFSNDGDYTYKPFSVTKTIKVTKTGK